jgi:hypothetical protein
MALYQATGIKTRDKSKKAASDLTVQLRFWQIRTLPQQDRVDAVDSVDAIDKVARRMLTEPTVAQEKVTGAVKRAA